MGNKFYGRDITTKLGDLKEIKDNIRDFNKSWHEKDTKIDYINNSRGMDFIDNNPKSKRKDIYNIAIMQAMENYIDDYLK